MVTRFALVFGGGLSFGSYIGGAATELLLALEGNSREEPVTVDVITSASAGALTGALAARTLRVNRHLLPFIEHAWVDGIDASLLIHPGRTDRSSWLDVSVIEDLSRALITAEPASDDVPSAALGEPLRVGFTLTNLNGIRYDAHTGFVNAPGRWYATQQFEDQIDFTLTSEHGAGTSIWEDVRQAAVASAAFPLAFPPQILRRSVADFPGASLWPDAGTDLRMPYVDGGLFDSSPIGLARKLAARTMAGDDGDRRYILVEPSLRHVGAEAGAPSIPTGLPETVGALARAILGHGAARDWVRANRVNNRLEILRSLVERLPDLGDRLGDPEEVSIGRQIGALAERAADLELLAGRGSASPSAEDPTLELLDEGLARIEADPRYAATLARADSRAGKARLAKFIFVLECACGLRDKEPMPLYPVSPERPGELAGDFMGNFGSFFSREWRAHDFRAGRRDARRLLEESLSDVIAYDPDPDEAYRVEAIEPSFDAIPSEGKRRLEALLNEEAGRVLAGMHPGFVGSLTRWAWERPVRNWLAGRMLSALRKLR